MHIMAYVGKYILLGLILHFGWTTIMQVWMYHKVGKHRYDEALEHYMALKIKLYDKHSGLKEAKMFLEHLANMGGLAWAAMLAFTLVIWPIALFEDIAIYKPTFEYMLDVANGEGES